LAMAAEKEPLEVGRPIGHVSDWGHNPICCFHASAREGSMLPAGVLRSTPELTVMTEAGLAALRQEDGIRVRSSVGRQWGEIFRGFYQPIHLLARLRRAEIRRPTLACWGYRAALTDEDAGSANASMPVHLLSDVGHFTEAALGGSRTRDLRKCRQQVEIRRERDPAVLVDQGYAVFMSAQRRTDFYSRPATEAEFRLRMEQQVSDVRRLFVVGIVNGKLGGYLQSFAVEGVLYPHELYVASECMRTGIGTGLYVDTIAIAARSGAIEEACFGLDTPDRAGISAFKVSMGAPLVDVPSRCVIPAPLDALIKRRRPAAHYRLTGRR
jgi:hypothetical protein